MTIIGEIGTRQDLQIKQGSDFGPINFVLSNGAVNGDFNLATQYIVNDEVVYAGSVYKCILASLNNLPTNVIYWKVITSPIDITSGDIRAQIRKTGLSEDVIAAFTIDKTSTNEFNLSLNNAITIGIPCGESMRDEASQYVWDMEFALGDYIQPLFYGTVKVFREVTK